MSRLIVVFPDYNVAPRLDLDELTDSRGIDALRPFRTLQWN